jgi:hypothetical protein
MVHVIQEMRATSGIGAHDLGRPRRNKALGRAFFPAFKRETVVDALHRDATLHGTYERAEVAAHTMVLIHTRNTFKRRDRTVAAQASGVEFRNRRSRDKSCGLRLDHPRGSSRIGYRRCPIKMNALMRSIPAGGVAKLATDA